MPSPRSRIRGRRGYSEEHIAELTSGAGWLHPFWANGMERSRYEEAEGDPVFAAQREAWDELRDQILTQWVQERPFTRPWAWWKFDAPERRRCLNRDHPFDTAEFKRRCLETEMQYPGYTHWVSRLTWGLPALRCGSEINPVVRPIFETERAYLDRLDLLSDHERELLATNQIPALPAPATAG